MFNHYLIDNKIVSSLSLIAMTARVSGCLKKTALYSGRFFIDIFFRLPKLLFALPF
ncbi:MAG: hypothetical protein J6W29_06565 [Neisseriaceae bacterium]|nr:hypothetical protein [Neisseriaceae bacterium]